MQTGRKAVCFGAVLAILLIAVQAGEKVLTLSGDDFDAAVKEHAFLVVEFYAPWCGHCKQLAPEYEKAATTLEGDMSAGVAITLAKVDATLDSNKALAEKFGIGGFPTIKIFADHSMTPTEYEGPREASGIVSFLKKLAGPASTELTSAEAALAMKEEERVLVVYAAEASDAWTAVANSMRDSAAWAHTSDKQVMTALGVSAGKIAIFRSFADTPLEYTGSDTDKDAIKAFVDAERIEVGMFVKKGDQAALKVVFEDDSKPNLFLFTSDSKASLDAFKAAAMTVKGKMVSGYFMATDFPEAFGHFGMDKYGDEGLPKVVIEDRSKGERFLLEDASVTEATVTAFLEAFQAGTLDAFLKSEPEPTDNNGPVKVIVGDTFKDGVLNAGKWVFLEAYAPWCGHCKKLVPIWEDLGRAFAGNANVVIAKVDATANDLPKSLEIKGFPTLLLFAGDGKDPQRYTGKRDFAQLAAFVEGNTGAKVPNDFKPTAAPAVSNIPLEKHVLKFLATDFQVPFLEEGKTLSGLWISAIVIFLLFVASMALVIAFLAKDPPVAREKTD